MNRTTWLLSILTFMLLVACGDNNSTSNAVEEKPTIGKIQFSATPITAKRLEKIYDDSADVDIDLGLIKATKSFYFILKNVGGTPIESLTITSGFDNIDIQPGYIATLETDGNSSLTQIVNFTALHGISPETGESILDVMTYGLHEFTVFFDGISAGEKFHAEFTFAIRSIYVDFEYAGIPGNGIMLDEGQYMGDTCSVFDPVTNKYVSIGDTAFVATGTTADGRLQDYHKLKSDCVVKPLIPMYFEK